MTADGQHSLRDEDLADLAALADGSLSEGRRAAVEARVAASPELEAALAEQRRAVSMIRAAAAETEAPAALRARVAAERRARAPQARRRRLVLGVVAAGAAAAVVLAVVLPSGAGGPSLASAASLAERGIAAPAPAPVPGRPTLLQASQSGLPFPAWARKFGWRTVGARTDTTGGRSTTTVFYRKNGHTIGYTIVSGSTLGVPKDASRLRREGTELRALTFDGRRLVTWVREGHTCLLSGRGVDTAVLAKLAAWKGRGTVPF